MGTLKERTDGETVQSKEFIKNNPEIGNLLGKKWV